MNDKMAKISKIHKILIKLERNQLFHDNKQAEKLKSCKMKDDE